jgi:mRNA interferase RelE/StbE
MAYRVEIGPAASDQMDALDVAVATSIERKIIWLAENAANILHRRLVGMPSDLQGLCKLRIGDYRVLYWIDHDQQLLRLYRVQHRSAVYRDL